MLTDNLFDKVLMEPVRRQGADRIVIVSGYATGSMAHYHMSSLQEDRLYAPIAVELIVGMASVGGVVKAQHATFLRLIKARQGSGMQFQCRYVISGNPVHAKVFTWLRKGQPVRAFAGSANYTLTGFGESQTEAMCDIDPAVGFAFYQSILGRSRKCSSPEIEGRIQLLAESPAWTPYGRTLPDSQKIIYLPLVTRGGETHNRAGLNWGQRPGRNPDQAYIPVPAKHYGFFPPVSKPFAVLTDDGHSFVMVRAQERGKAIHTPDDNSLMGRYFRKRIGVPSGQRVNRGDLDQYGRADVGFQRIDAETYLMDFGVT